MQRSKLAPKPECPLAGPTLTGSYILRNFTGIMRSKKTFNWK